MSFSTNKLKPVQPTRTFVRLSPRKRITTWLQDGSEPDIWYGNWADGNLVGLFKDSPDQYLERKESEAEALAEAESYFYDEDSGAITLNAPSYDPNQGFIVAEWHMFLCSEQSNWFQNPMDVNSGDADWEGGVVSSPAPKQGNPDLLFGFSPIQITSLSIQVADGSMMKHLHDFSLNRSQIKVWLCIGDLDAANISEIFTGFCGDYTMRGGVLTINVQDPLEALDSIWAGDHFNTDDFPELDENCVGYPIREVFGHIPNFIPVNIDYDRSTATNKNREWVVCKGELAKLPILSTAVIFLSPDNSAFQTKVADASRFRRGDSIIVEDNGVDLYTDITAIDYANNLISHFAIPRAGPVVTDTVRRGFIGSIGVLTSRPGDALQAYQKLRYGLHWTEHDFANGTVGFRLADNFEADLLMWDSSTTFDPAIMPIKVAVYGGNELPKKLDGVTNMGSLSSDCGTASHPASLIWEILRNRVPAFRDNVVLDEQAFSDMAAAFDRQIGLAVPEQINSDFPSYKDVIQLLLQTELMKLHFKIEDGICMYTISQTAPSSGGGEVISNLNFGDESWEWRYSDCYNIVKFQLNAGEIDNPIFTTVDVNTTYTWPDSFVEKSPMRAAEYLHRVSKEFPFRSLFPYASDSGSNLVAMRLAKIVGERKGTLSGFLPRSFLEESIDDEAELSLERLPGYPVNGTEHSRNYKLQSHQKSAFGVQQAVLDDQKGVEDAGRW